MFKKIIVIDEHRIEAVGFGTFVRFSKKRDML